MVFALIMALLQMKFDDVFVSGRIDPKVPYDTFRIPAICRTSKGTLLAFAEGRRSVSDQAANVLVLRRRKVRSSVWTPLQVVVKDEPNSLNNPCVLAVKSGRIWLMYQRYPAGLNELTVHPGFDPEKSCRTFLVWSDSDGDTWSDPREITREIKGHENRSSASGPGVGIQLQSGTHKGRLCFPINEGSGGKYNVFAIFSDDQGKTWVRGEIAPKTQGTEPNETQIVELQDGSILMNCRNQSVGKFRLQCRSQDGGKTWNTVSPVQDLVDPVCMGSITRLPGRDDLILLSNPNDRRQRQNGWIKVSRDRGLTWHAAQRIVPGSFAYSVLVPLTSTRCGILFESVDDLGNGREGYKIHYGEFEIPK